MGLHSIGREKVQLSDKTKIAILAWYRYQRDNSNTHARIWITPAGRFSYNIGRGAWGTYAERMSLSTLHYYGEYYGSRLNASNFNMSMIEKPK